MMIMAPLLPSLCIKYPVKGPCNSAPRQISELTHVASSFVIGSELVGDSCKNAFSIKLLSNSFEREANEFQTKIAAYSSGVALVSQWAKCLLNR